MQDGQYERVDTEDNRFSDHFGSLQSIVTSSAQNDSGLFETNLHDERYLPFENSGVISEWQLELPANPANHDPCQFDYETISDVIMHMRYTGREGGGLLRNTAIEHNKALIASAKAAGTTRLFSLRREFPSAWAKFKKQAAIDGSFRLIIEFLSEHYPFWAQDYLQKNIKRVNILANKNLTITIKTDNATLTEVNLEKDIRYGGLLVKEIDDTSTSLPEPVETWEMLISNNDIDDLWIAINWAAE